MFFLKSKLIFKIFYCFRIFVNKHFINTGTCISKSKRYFKTKPSAYNFYVRTPMALNFHVCISVPLNAALLISPLNLVLK